MQRLKFYAFHKLDTLVQRGFRDWGSLPPVYCIALLSKGILPGSNCHTLANLRTETGELLDSQLTFVLAELDKFHLPTAAVHTDLEKLLFTMQTLEDPLRALENRPDFWEESWLQDALHVLSTRNMPPEQYEQMRRSMLRRAAIIQQEEDWAEAAAAKEQAAAAKEQAAAAKEQAAAAEEQAAAAKEQAAAANEQAAAANEQAAAAREQAAAAREQAAAAREQAAAAELRTTAAELQAATALESTVRNLLRQGRLTVEEIADSCGITPEQVRRLQP